MKDGTSVTLPKLRRTKSQKMICREYLAMKTRTTEPKALIQTSFMRIIALTTSGKQEIKKSVDYCLIVLVFENIRNLEYIVEKRVMDVRLRKELNLKLSAVGDYLKHGYKSHLDLDEDSAHKT